MINKIKDNKRIFIFAGVFVLVLVIAIAIFTTLSGSSVKRIQEQLALGNKYLEELNYEQAIASFNTVLEIDPQNEDAYFALVDAYARLDDADSMAAVYDRALNNLTEEQLSKLADKISEKLILMIEAAINSGDYDRAGYIVDILKRFNSEKASEYEIIIEESKKVPVTVPDIIDTLWEESQKELDSIGLLYDVTEENGMELPGYVLSVSPSAGSDLFEGDKVSVTVSAGFANIPDEMVEVDDLLGMTVADARNMLAEKYLYIVTDGRDFSDDIPKDGICVQSIEAGTKIKTGETVHVTVSDGIELVEVPDIVGMMSEEAQSAIADHKLVARVNTVVDETKTEGLVVSQSLPAGSSVDKNSVIVIDIVSHVRLVPDFMGMTNTECESIIAKSGIKNVSYDYLIGEENKVIAQSPAAGTAMDDNTVVKVYLGMTPEKFIQLYEEHINEDRKAKGLPALAVTDNANQWAKKYAPIVYAGYSSSEYDPLWEMGYSYNPISFTVRLTWPALYVINNSNNTYPYNDGEMGMYYSAEKDIFYIVYKYPQ